MCYCCCSCSHISKDKLFSFIFPDFHILYCCFDVFIYIYIICSTTNWFVSYIRWTCGQMLFSCNIFLCFIPLPHKIESNQSDLLFFHFILSAINIKSRCVCVCVLFWLYECNFTIKSSKSIFIRISIMLCLFNWMDQEKKITEARIKNCKNVFCFFLHFFYQFSCFFFV